MEEKERYSYDYFIDGAVFIDTENDHDMDMDTVCSLLNQQDQQIADLEAKLAESEKKVKHWHNLYNERDKQFQSVRQRYHLLNKLQSNYDKKDKLHLAYMQCAELVDENERLKQQLEEKDADIIALDTDNYSFKQQIDNLRQQLKSQPAEIVEKIKEQIFNHFNVKNMEEYENLSLIDSLFTADAVIEMLDTILKEYQK